MPAADIFPNETCPRPPVKIRTSVETYPDFILNECNRVVLV